MELGLCLDDDFYTQETKGWKPKEKPYNVKLCEREWIFNSPICRDKVEKQNITKFQADVWYRDGKYAKALQSYQFMQENPQVSSSTVKREINESVARCHIKMKQFDEGAKVIRGMLAEQGDDTSLILMLAKICAATGNIEGEIACFKRCMSLHSYNHHFWYLLASAYTKAYKDKESHHFTGANQNGKISNNEAVASRVSEALRQSKPTNHKDSLKIFISCCHCKCLRDMCGINKCSGISQDRLVKDKNKNQPTKEEETLGTFESENTCVPAVDEIVILMEGLSINSENESGKKTDDSVSCNLSKANDDTKDIESNDSHQYLGNFSDAASGYVMAAQEQGSCSFSVKLKPSKHCLHQTAQPCDKMSKDQQNLFAFFCLIRARFHLQRAVWASSSFIKERLANELSEVNKRIEKYEPCKCGELKGCCLKFMSQRTETINPDITCDQKGE